MNIEETGILLVGGFFDGSVVMPKKNLPFDDRVVMYKPRKLSSILPPEISDRKELEVDTIVYYLHQLHRGGEDSRNGSDHYYVYIPHKSLKNGEENLETLMDRVHNFYNKVPQSIYRLH